MLGIAIIVWSSCLLFSLVEGLRHSLNVSGDPLDLIVLRKGSTNELNSGISTEKADDLLTLGGIARDESGAPLAAAELVDIPVVKRLDGSRTNIIIRGVSAASPKLRPRFTITQGRYFTPGKGECVVSRGLANRFEGTALGAVLKYGQRENYRVVGIFTAGGSAAESEVWTDLKELRRNVGREGIVSCVQLRAASAADLARLKATIERETRFKLDAPSEADYFAQQAMTANFLKAAGTLIAVLLSIGAMFAAANTMYAAVRARTREIGTMRALGFSRADILRSFLLESVLLCGMGGVLGLLATVPMSAYRFGISNFNTFTETTIAFRFGPIVLTVAVVMTLAMGLFGGLFPALRAVRLDVIRALREA